MGECIVSRLEGKVALVTGAARGIGRGIALRLPADGADVILNDRDHLDEAEALAEQLRAQGRRALVHMADVSDRSAVEALVTHGVLTFGHLDLAVANAGISIREPILEAQWANVERTLAVTQFGVFHTCQLAARQMAQQPINGRARGKIVMIGSIHEEQPAPTSAAYNMAKAAINHLARTMAAELAGMHINVNVVNPGWIDTPGERQHASEEALTAGGKRIPWGRLGVPEDIGHVVAFLASDEADYITGATLRVDGGFMLGLHLPE